MTLGQISGPIRIIIVLALAWAVSAAAIWVYSDTVADRLHARGEAALVEMEALAARNDVAGLDALEKRMMPRIERRDRLDDWAAWASFYGPIGLAVILGGGFAVVWAIRGFQKSPGAR